MRATVWGGRGAPGARAGSATAHGTGSKAGHTHTRPPSTDASAAEMRWGDVAPVVCSNFWEKQNTPHAPFACEHKQKKPSCRATGNVCALRRPERGSRLHDLFFARRSSLVLIWSRSLARFSLARLRARPHATPPNLYTDDTRCFCLLLHPLSTQRANSQVPTNPLNHRPASPSPSPKGPIVRSPNPLESSPRASPPPPQNEQHPVPRAAHHPGRGGA